MERVQCFPVKLGASYLCYDHTDYAKIAFLFADHGLDLLGVKRAWKGETALAELVSQVPFLL